MFNLVHVSYMIVYVFIRVDKCLCVYVCLMLYVCMCHMKHCQNNYLSSAKKYIPKYSFNFVYENVSVCVCLCVCLNIFGCTCVQIYFVVRV